MSSPDSLAITAELERVLSSRIFKQSNVLSNFLRYVVTETVEERTNEIKEYSIAVRALGKPIDFNPQTDAVIRIHAGRLRRCLHEYYDGEGVNNGLVITLAKGGYIPEFLPREFTNESSERVFISSANNHTPINRVAVLPFKNLSGLPENNFMADGFCEQLSADLARFPEIVVVAYFSTAKFREEKTDIREVGKALHTSHLITGSIYHDKTHLRISIQLVNANTGAQVWTQTYNRTLKSNFLFDVFDEIISELVPRLTGYYGLISRTCCSLQVDAPAEPGTLDAVFWYYHYQTSLTEELFQIARAKLEKAVQVNPNYALAWGILAQLYVDGGAYCYRSINDSLAEAQKCVQHALHADPDCQHAHLSLAWLFIFLKDKKSAIESINRCISINPRSAFFLGAASFLMSCLGEYDDSLEYFKKSHGLNPYHPWWVSLGPVLTHFYRAEYNLAFEYANNLNMPAMFWDPIFKIATLGQLSRTAEAAALVSTFQIEFPGKAEASSSILKTILFDDLLYDRIIEGLCKAGLPV